MLSCVVVLVCSDIGKYLGQLALKLKSHAHEGNVFVEVRHKKYFKVINQRIITE